MPSLRHQLLATLMPHRLLVRRAAEADCDLTDVDEPDLIHVYGLLPLTPESRRAFRQVVESVR